MFQCFFCKTPVPVGTMKCKICGSRVFESVGPLEDEVGYNPQNRPDSVSPSAPNQIFSTPDWENAYSLLRSSADTLCLVLTNTADLEDSSAFTKALDRYIQSRRGSGVQYCILDMADQYVVDEIPYDCEETVELLQTVYEVAEPDYLFILGDHTAVPSQVWRNDGDNCDTNILSDLPYITLDADSPWSGVIFDFSYAVPAGRVPTSAENHFSEAVTYLNFMAERSVADKAKSFAYSTASWEATSRSAFGHLSPNMELSPPCTISRQQAGRAGYRVFGGIDNSYNLLCFNLHGGSTTNLWIGESAPNSRGDTTTTVAFHPSYFPETPGGYVVCSEACYGANPIIAKSGEPSALLHAMTNGCVGFVGSTRVAWGTGNGSLFAADVVAAYFTRGTAKGMPLGDAYLDCLQVLVSDENGPDEKEIKTLAEFALYGDPSATLTRSASGAKKVAKKKTRAHVSVTKKDPSRAVSLLDCNLGVIQFSNLSAAKKQEVLLKAERITLSCQKFVQMNCASVSGIQPQIFKVMGQSGYRAYVNKMSDVDWGGMCLHYDDDCNLKVVCYTK